MTRRAVAGALISFLLLAGCATVDEPVLVKIGATDRLVGEIHESAKDGTFAVYNNDAGLSCSGTYDPVLQLTLLKFTLQCTDGRYGTGLVQRDASFQTGAGKGTLNDGTPFQIAFGDRVLK